MAHVGDVLDVGCVEFFLTDSIGEEAEVRVRGAGGKGELWGGSRPDDGLAWEKACKEMASTGIVRIQMIEQFQNKSCRDAECHTLRY